MYKFHKCLLYNNNVQVNTAADYIVSGWPFPKGHRLRCSTPPYQQGS